MKVLLLAFVWCISFVTMAITCLNLNPVFWIAFAVFALDSVYMSKNHKKLEIEIDEIFGK